MFKIDYIKLYSLDDKCFTYTFSYGINFFKGKNDSGKTEFYAFIDYMFGKTIKDISKKEWYSGTLKRGELKFCFNNIEYILSRELTSDENFFSYADSPSEEPLPFTEYRERINSVFATDLLLLKQLRDFSEENLTYRTFTLFNFLGENRLGVTQDFFDKCSKLEYSIKLPLILNFLFNNNIEHIFSLKKKVEDIKRKLSKIESASQNNEHYANRINAQLRILGISKIFNGKNSADIISEIEKVKQLEDSLKSPDKSKSTSELETIYNSLTEQIKLIETGIIDSKRFSKENENRKQLLGVLESLVAEHAEYHYLIDPIVSITSDLNKSISFSKYMINDKTLFELKKQQQAIRTQLISNDYKFNCYDIADKSKAMLIVEEYLNNYDSTYDPNEVGELRTRLRELNVEIRSLQQSDDTSKIENLSDRITSLYLSASDVSEIVQTNANSEGFKLQYIKMGNIIQPQIVDNENTVNYYVGSMARHTLFQLCGYLGFLDLFNKEKKYPVIPLFVIDHISKSFDDKNIKAIGPILSEFYKKVNKIDFQIIIFDDKNSKTLGIDVDQEIELVTEGKSGFNPFFIKVNQE